MAVTMKNAVFLDIRTQLVPHKKHITSLVSNCMTSIHHIPLYHPPTRGDEILSNIAHEELGCRPDIPFPCHTDQNVV
jgi:hypothetical protein